MRLFEKVGRAIRLTEAGYGSLFFTRGSSLSIGGGNTVDFTGTMTFEAGLGFTAPFNATGANDGTVDQIGDSNIFAGLVTGTRLFNFEFSTSLYFESSVSAGQTINFGDIDGRLRSPTTFDGTIQNFSPGNLIDFTNLTATGATYDASVGWVRRWYDHIVRRHGVAGALRGRQFWT